MDQFMPLTFHVTNLEDEEWTSFKAAFMKHTQDEDETRATNLWILKPASMSNRGFGIRVANDLAVRVPASFSVGESSQRWRLRERLMRHRRGSLLNPNAGDRGHREHRGAEGC